MMLRKFVLIFFIGLMAIGATGYKPLKVGDKAPLFVLRTADGIMISLHSMCGARVIESRRKVVVLGFFQVTCEPCIEELPQIKNFHAMWKDDKRVEFYMVGVGETQARLVKFREKYGTQMPLLADQYFVTAKNYGVDTFPVAVIIGTDGHVKYIVKDKQENIDQLLTAELKKVLGQ